MSAILRRHERRRAAAARSTRSAAGAPRRARAGRALRRTRPGRRDEERRLQHAELARAARRRHRRPRPRAPRARARRPARAARRAPPRRARRAGCSRSGRRRPAPASAAGARAIPGSASDDLAQDLGLVVVDAHVQLRAALEPRERLARARRPRLEQLAPHGLLVGEHGPEPARDDSAALERALEHREMGAEVAPLEAKLLARERAHERRQPGGLDARGPPLRRRPRPRRRHRIRADDAVDVERRRGGCLRRRSA